MSQEKIDLKELKKLLSPLSLLYVEDNLELQEKATLFFEKLFGTVLKANNGEEGLTLFKAYRPSIIITDIQMPRMNGLEMAQCMREIDPNVKIIVTSAYDEKEYLLKSITLGISGYLVKPLKAEEISHILYTIASKLAEEHSKTIFHTYLHSIFNHQENLLMMLKNNDIVLANDKALSFFNVSSLELLHEKIPSFDTIFLPHDTFLYHHEKSTTSCLNYVKENIEKLYNVKIRDEQSEPRHFILKLTHISDEEQFYILSLTDITQLNLLSLYDEKSLEHDKVLQDQKTISNLLEAAKEAGAVVKLYNYYKGLTICNNGLITHVGDASFTCKTSLLQLRAAKLEQKIIINCELFPYDMQSLEIKEFNFRYQTLEITACKMLKTTPLERKYLVLEPDPKHKVTLFYDKHSFKTNLHLINISIESVRLFMEYLPAGFKENDEIILDIVFNDSPKPLIINTKASIYKIISYDKAFHVIAKLAFTQSSRETLVEYMASRQMQLIREFKGLQV